MKPSVYAGVLLSLSLLSRKDDVSGLSADSVLSRPASKMTKPINNNNKKKGNFPLWSLYDKAFRESELDSELLSDFFSERPHVIAHRLAKVSTTLLTARKRWQSSTPKKSEKEEQSRRAHAHHQQLCESISKLGPVAVKIGQTLAQRPDMVGDEVAQALASLQTNNVAFPNEWAYRVLRQELMMNRQEFIGAPLAHGIWDQGIVGEDNPRPLFKSMTKDPVACASLGQVYRATTWDGLEVAVKVQRPDAISILAQDAYCFQQVFQTRRRVQHWLTTTTSAARTHDEIEKQEQQDLIEQKQDISAVVERVAREVLNELDYRLEAANADEFRDSLAFLGFVTTPTIVPEYSSTRVLVTEWVQGRHLSDLTVDEGLSMTRMAIQACTASLTVTGLVHSDPHQGNVMLHDDGRLVFLDFGLVSRVDPGIMEGFASGIQALLSEDWTRLTQAFVDVGFVTEPIMHRNGLNDTWRVDPEFDLPELAKEVALAMEKVDGGKARFGALAQVLNKEISPTWLVYTPPYVLLLVRTFLTLEGMAAQLDPAFNIYEMALPWAVRRSLSPETRQGTETLRSTLMTEDNLIQWERLLQLVNVASSKAYEKDKMPATPLGTPVGKADANGIYNQGNGDKTVAMKNAVGSLLGAPSEGRALRRALYDLDSTDLLRRLASYEGRRLLRNALQRLWSSTRKTSRTLDNKEYQSPVSQEYQTLLKKESRWRKQVTRHLVWAHIVRQIGIKGLWSVTRFSVSCTIISTTMLLERLTFGMRNTILSISRHKLRFSTAQSH